MEGEKKKGNREKGGGQQLRTHRIFLKKSRRLYDQYNVKVTRYIFVSDDISMVTARHRKGQLSQRAAIAKMVCARVSTLNQWRSEGRCIGDSCPHGRPKRRRRRAPDYLGEF